MGQREHSARQRSGQVGRDNRPAPEGEPRSRRLPSQRAQGSSSKELEDTMEHRLEDKEKYGRNEPQNAASDLYAAREDKEREEARLSGPDGHPGRYDDFAWAYAHQDSPTKLRDARKLQRDSIIKEMESLFSQQTSSGSVPYGLPTIALTRRTLDVQIKAKQIEMINDKLIRILRRPQDYVDLSCDEDSD